ncbi:SpnB-like Rossmann fold domain-containing protein, partial [Streptomyces fuscichromogenes]|uniref:SpnB-like Rossmann fold domain-containing protein n=1 Tax=Streptomyces fuscichromogenes TaxID=1324013 RepID=UPI001670D14A
TGHTPHHTPQHTTPTTYHLTATTPHHPTTPTLTINQLTLHPITTDQLRGGSSGAGETLHAVNWVPLPGGAQPVGGLSAAVVGDADSALVRALGAGTPAYAGLEDLSAADGRVPDVVFLDLPGRSTEPAADAAHGVVGEVLEVVQRWLADERFAAALLCVVTRGAQATRPGEDVTDLPGAAVWGLVRAAQTENPGCFTLLDLGEGGESDGRSLRAAAGAAAGERQLALRDGELFANRLVRAAADPVLVPPDDTPGWCLGSSGKGSLDKVALVASASATEPLAPGQVRVAVRAVGLNFRDVLIALGSYPGEAPMGSEGAGVVVETGPGVTGLAVGDRVMGLFGDGGGPLAVTDRRTLVRVPEGWTFAQAATVPIVFLTAYYGLVDLAGLKAGERLLV